MKTHEMLEDIKANYITYEGKRQGHIRTLVRRRNFLKKRLTEERSNSSQNFDKLEYQALCEAVWVLENLYTYEFIYKELEELAKERFDDVQERAIRDIED